VRPTIVVKGPAELFWEETGPLLRAERYAEALAGFETYLETFPGDRSVQREYAITLDRAHRSREAVPVFMALLEAEDDPDLRVLLARSLRDQGRLQEASTQHELLVERAPGDVALTLEWSRALSWGQRYSESAAALEASLAVRPDAPEIRVELARILFWSGRVEEAGEVIAGMPADVLAEVDALGLRDDIVAANTSPPTTPQEPEVLSVLEQGRRAMAQEDYAAATELFRLALEEDPSDPEALSTYADLLQFQLEDLEGAREVLLRLDEPGPKLQLRIAQLAVWTGREEEAALRLEELLRDVQPGVRGGEYEAVIDEPQIAAIRALLGELYRWDGRRTEAAASYREALRVDPDNVQARSGLEDLRADVNRQVEEEESPGLGTVISSFSDSDDFNRLDLGLEGVFIEGTWVWTARSGVRLLEGAGSPGGEAAENGVFAEVEGARWWRWGTLRTGLRLGVEEVRPDGVDLSLGASLHWSDLGGFRTDLRFDHGPAYPLTVTLQSALGRLRQDRFSAGLGREIGDAWSLTLNGDAAWLDVAGSGAADGGEGSLRLEAGANLGRPVSESIVLGMSARALTYTEAAPTLAGRRLFWDPESVFSAGVYARWTNGISGAWELRTLLNPSVALIRERGSPGSDGVPHFSAEAGLTRRGARVRTSLDAFYYQGRFEGYRAYGLRFGVSMTDWLGRGGGP
jgi:tetratricopeptide (TPR) repeat protein